MAKCLSVMQCLWSGLARGRGWLSGPGGSLSLFLFLNRCWLLDLDMAVVLIRPNAKVLVSVSFCDIFKMSLKSRTSIQHDVSKGLILGQVRLVDNIMACTL